MNEEKQVKKQLKKNMLLNLLTFITIFYILGTSIYSQFKNSLYKSADAELNQTINQEMSRKEIKIMPNNIMDMKMDKQDEREFNPRLIKIIRDESGNVIENGIMNDTLNDIFKQAKFDTNLLGQIYNIEIGNYSYRGINYIDTNGNYVQVLINVNSEQDIAQKFVQNLIISFSIAIVIILIASYLLSKYTLKPIVESWKKQNRFVQDASHELRTPLTIIKAKQESLLEKPESIIIDNVEDISITLQETQRLTKLIKELMELAQNDSDTLKLNKEKFNLDKQIKPIINLYKDVAKTEEKELKINLNFNDEIIADQNKLKELLVILLDNSIKYTEEGDTIQVNTYKKDGKCVIEVEDTGIGISKESIDHIFERFYREEKSRNRAKGGMGLGLSIAYNIVSLHKGTIKFDKTREKGTKAIIKLPIK